MNRGLVIPSSMLVDEIGTRTSIGGSIPPAVVRHWLMFWDEFDCPTNGFIGTGLSSELLDLKQLGVLNQTHVEMSGHIRSGDFGRLFLTSQKITCERLNVADPGKWTMASPEGIITSSSTTSLSGAISSSFENSLIFELANAFQVPANNVPLEDILEFKGRRRDELEAFHRHLDEVYEKIVSSGDIIRSRSVEIRNLESAIGDYNKVQSELFSESIRCSLKVVVERSAAETVMAGIAGAGLAPTIGLPSLAFGVTLAGLTFMVKNIFNTNDGSHRPLTYISSLHRNLRLMH